MLLYSGDPFLSNDWSHRANILLEPIKNQDVYLLILT
jgi:hypothetical protein